jgi:hypothetical protein
MQEVNLPRHVIETFEEKWARKLQQEAPAWRSARSPARSGTDSGTDSGVPVARRSRRPRFAAGVSFGEIMPARLSEEADRAGTCHPLSNRPSHPVQHKTAAGHACRRRLSSEG